MTQLREVQQFPSFPRAQGGWSAALRPAPVGGIFAQRGPREAAEGARA